MDEILASIRRIIADDDPGQMPARGNSLNFRRHHDPQYTQSDLGVRSHARGRAAGAGDQGR